MLQPSSLSQLGRAPLSRTQRPLQGLGRPSVVHCARWSSFDPLNVTCEAQAHSDSLTNEGSEVAGSSAVERAIKVALLAPIILAAACADKPAHAARTRRQMVESELAHIHRSRALLQQHSKPASPKQQPVLCASSRAHSKPHFASRGPRFLSTAAARALLTAAAASSAVALAMWKEGKGRGEVEGEQPRESAGSAASRIMELEAAFRAAAAQVSAAAQQVSSSAAAAVKTADCASGAAAVASQSVLPRAATGGLSSRGSAQVGALEGAPATAGAVEGTSWAEGKGVGQEMQAGDSAAVTAADQEAVGVTAAAAARAAAARPAPLRTSFVAPPKGAASAPAWDAATVPEAALAAQTPAGPRPSSPGTSFAVPEGLPASHAQSAPPGAPGAAAAAASAIGRQGLSAALAGTSFQVPSAPAAPTAPGSPAKRTSFEVPSDGGIPAAVPARAAAAAQQQQQLPAAAGPESPGTSFSVPKGVGGEAATLDARGQLVQPRAPGTSGTSFAPSGVKDVSKTAAPPDLLSTPSSFLRTPFEDGAQPPSTSFENGAQPTIKLRVRLNAATATALAAAAAVEASEPRPRPGSPSKQRTSFNPQKAGPGVVTTAIRTGPGVRSGSPTAGDAPQRTGAVAPRGPPPRGVPPISDWSKQVDSLPGARTSFVVPEEGSSSEGGSAADRDAAAAAEGGEGAPQLAAPGGFVGAETAAAEAAASKLAADLARDDLAAGVEAAAAADAASTAGSAIGTTAGSNGKGQGGSPEPKEVATAFLGMGAAFWDALGPMGKSLFKVASGGGGKAPWEGVDAFGRPLKGRDGSEQE